MGNSEARSVPQYSESSLGLFSGTHGRKPFGSYYKLLQIWNVYPRAPNARDNIGPISPIQWPQSIDPLRQTGNAQPGAFGDVFSSALNTVSQNGADASQTVENFLNGEGEDIHNVVLAQQRASLSLDLFLQVRNKVVNAYQEVMRMQV